MELFDQDELFEIDLIYSNAREAARVEAEVRRVLAVRHGGTEDFTVTSQEAMLDVFGKVMDVVTMAVGAIAGISLLVGATGILTMMWIAVGERTSEIGLVRALGATRGQVQALFLAEAAALATLGGIAGIVLGLGLGAALRLFVPGLPVETPVRFVVAGLATSVAHRPRLRRRPRAARRAPRPDRGAACRVAPPAEAPLLRFALPDGRPATLLLGEASTVLSVDDALVSSWDLAGRPYALVRETGTYRRGLDGRLLWKREATADGPRLRRRLSAAEGEPVVEAARRDAEARACHPRAPSAGPEGSAGDSRMLGRSADGSSSG